MSQSLDRGLRILDEIAAGRTTLADMSESLGVHKSTVLRLLVTLQQHHFVHRADAHHYKLGRRLFDLASFAIESRDIATLARPAMDRLQQSTGHSVHLATYEDGEIVVVEVAPARRRLQRELRVGEALPLHATASGKVLAAALSATEMEMVLGPTALPGYTDRTIREVSVLQTELERVSASGFALEGAEHEGDISAVAAPVRDSTGAVVAAMALTVPVAALEGRDLTAFTPRLLESCDAVARELGWS